MSFIWAVLMRFYWYSW